MVKIGELPSSAERPERPWFHIGEAVGKQEQAIREYAQREGFENLRGYWKHVESMGWDYYDVLKEVSP
jgi:hypothetical protein